MGGFSLSFPSFKCSWFSFGLAVVVLLVVLELVVLIVVLFVVVDVAELVWISLRVGVAASFGGLPFSGVLLGFTIGRRMELVLDIRDIATV